MGEALGFMLGVWCLWLAQGYWQVYRKPMLEMREIKAALLQRQMQRLGYYNTTSAAYVDLR